MSAYLVYLALPMGKLVGIRFFGLLKSCFKTLSAGERVLKQLFNYLVL